MKCFVCLTESQTLNCLVKIIPNTLNVSKNSTSELTAEIIVYVGLRRKGGRTDENRDISFRSPLARP